jgi:GGDEF domain-containing protein
VLPGRVADSGASARIEADVLQNDVLWNMAEPMHVGDHVLQVIPRIGIAVQAGSARDAGRLMRAADAAMYGSKRAKANAVPG